MNQFFVLMKFQILRGWSIKEDKCNNAYGSKFNNSQIVWLKFVIVDPLIPVVFEPFSKNSRQTNLMFAHDMQLIVDPLPPLQ